MATVAQDFTLDADNIPQQSVLQLIRETNQCLFLTGKAGTGKSTLLRYIHEHTHKRHVMLASTGIAALNVGGQTIHSFFKLPTRPLPPDDPDLSTERNRIYEVFRYTKEHKTLIRALDLIIIDEISMVRSDVIDAIDKLLRVYRGKLYEPFGGVQMLFVGDLLQLEPVVKGDERSVLDRFYRSHYFYGAKVFEELPLVSIELEKVYRQTEGAFVETLDRIRAGKANYADIQLLNTRVNPTFEPDSSELIITLGTKRTQVAAINDEQLGRIKYPAETFACTLEGDFPEHNLPTERNLVLKQGAQVMFLANDRERRWANGTIGTVEHIDTEQGHIYVGMEDGQTHSVQPYVWENVRYSYDEEEGKVVSTVLGRFIQYPLQLAWAITIHKSQGLTFDRVVVDFTDRVFAGGQAYVALSRCRSLEGMTLKAPLQMRDIITRHEVAVFYSTMNNPEIIAGAVERAEAQRGYVKAIQQWNRAHYGEAVETFASALAGSNLLSQPQYLRLLRRKLYEVETLHQELMSMRQELAESRRELRQLALEHVAMGDECLSLASDAEAAHRCYAKALRFDPRSVEALIGQSKAYDQEGDRGQAMSALEEALALSPLHPGALYAMGALRLRYRLYDEAHATLRRLYDLQPEDIPTLRLLVEVCEALDEEDQAGAYRLLIDRLTESTGKKKARSKGRGKQTPPRD